MDAVAADSGGPDGSDPESMPADENWSYPATLSRLRKSGCG